MNSAQSTDRSGTAIVVGVDGTPAGREALVFALREGALRGTPVEVVSAWTFDGAYDEWIGPENIEQARDNAQRLQDETVAAALSEVPEPPEMSRHLLEGAPARVLVEASRHAAYLVVGSGHKSLVRRALVGSVSHACIQHADVPVVVVPAPAGALKQAEESVKASR